MINLFSHLKRVVEREPVEENIGEELAQTEDPVHHPVRQPFCVIFFARTFNGFDSADKSGNKQSACVRWAADHWEIHLSVKYQQNYQSSATETCWCGSVEDFQLSTRTRSHSSPWTDQKPEESRRQTTTWSLRNTAVSQVSESQRYTFLLIKEFRGSSVGPEKRVRQVDSLFSASCFVSLKQFHSFYSYRTDICRADNSITHE